MVNPGRANHPAIRVKEILSSSLRARKAKRVISPTSRKASSAKVNRGKARRVRRKASQ